MRPRTLVRAIVVVLLLSAVGVAAYLLWQGLRDDGSVELIGFSEESTETVSFAGSFPADDWPSLENPLAIATDGERFFVAEADAGLIHVFSANGGTRGEIELVPGSEANAAYPASIAVVDDETLAVVDTAGQRAGLVPNDPGEEAAFEQLRPRGTGGLWGSPTAVAVGTELIWVADTAAGGILRYERDGTYVDTVGNELPAPLGPVGALSVHDGLVYVSDSVAGRVVVLGEADGAVVGALEKEMALPRGTAGGLDGRVWVTDRFEATVETFDASGAWLESFGDGSRTGTALSMPTDAVWFEETDRLYVVDATIGRVAVFNVRATPGVVSP